MADELAQRKRDSSDTDAGGPRMAGHPSADPDFELFLSLPGGLDCIGHTVKVGKRYADFVSLFHDQAP